VLQLVKMDNPTGGGSNRSIIKLRKDEIKDFCHFLDSVSFETHDPQVNA
jgi:hypothetical protein